jgi:cathepsin L
MLFLIALLAFASAEISAADHAAFKSWVGEHAKVYQSAEETQYRLSVFSKNAEFVRNWDAEARGFTVALNEHADLTTQEFKAFFNGLNITKEVSTEMSAEVPVSVPSSWDWRKEGAVTGVKNQGQCGSCWSFSATGSAEGAWFLKHKKLVSLSEQNLVDCSTAQGNMGCNGGLMDAAFQYIISNNGIDTEASYPYTATGPNPCRFNRANVGATLRSYTDVRSGDENALLNAVAMTPVSVAIDAGHQSFQLYSGGVYNEPACSSTQLDHGVLAIGWGTDNGTPYWLVKNSWGQSWGLNGYIMMSRNKRNQCGIATAASYPVV